MRRGTLSALSYIVIFFPRQHEHSHHHFIQTTKITNLASTLHHFVPLLVQRMGVFPFLEPAEEVLAPTVSEALLATLTNMAAADALHVRANCNHTLLQVRLLSLRLLLELVSHESCAGVVGEHLKSLALVLSKTFRDAYAEVKKVLDCVCSRLSMFAYTLHHTALYLVSKKYAQRL